MTIVMEKANRIDNFCVYAVDSSTLQFLPLSKVCSAIVKEAVNSNLLMQSPEFFQAEEESVS